MGAYLSDYAAKFVGLENVSLNCRVTTVERSADDRWEVQWQSSVDKRSESRVFDFMVVAAGHFAEPHILQYPGLKDFTGEPVLHSSQYRNPSSYQGKKVAVIGGGFSGVEIAADLAIHAKQLLHIVPRPFYVFPMHLPVYRPNEAPKFLPMDLVMNRLMNRPSLEESVLPDEKQIRQTHEFMQSFIGDQSDLSPELHVTELDIPYNMAISDHYAELARSGKIQIVQGKLESVEGTTLTLSTGVTIPSVDSIILSTGYHSSLPFLPSQILETVSFRPDDLLVPFLLYRDIIHPDLPKMAFVGMYRSPYWGVIELQARYVAALFSGRLPTPSRETLIQGIEREKAIRDRRPRYQFSHPDYVGLLSSLALDLGIHPLTDPVYPPDVNEIVHPATFASSSAISPRPAPTGKPASAALIASLAATICNSDAGTQFLAPAVFRALHGRWQLRRVLTSQISTSPSGVFQGTAEFVPRLSAGKSNIAGVMEKKTVIDEYLYREEGKLVVDSSNLEIPAYKSYVYRYMEDGADENERERIEVYFTKTDGSEEVDNFFHTIKFIGGSGVERKHEGERKGRGRWEATGEHLCAEDLYKAKYWFEFCGVGIERFGITFDVKGPKKDYRTVAEYCR